MKDIIDKNIDDETPGELSEEKPEIEETFVIQVKEDGENARLDKFLTENKGIESRTMARELITKGLVLVNDKPSKPSKKLDKGDEILVNIPKPSVLEVKPENLNLDIVYEDDDILIVNKPKDMVVHPSNGHITGTLVNGLMYYLKDNLSQINGVLRPGIVHRIDKDTTGLLVVCKNNEAHIKIASQLKEHSVTREYHGIVKGNLSEDGVINTYIGRDKNNRKKMAVVASGGKNAITHYEILEHFKGYDYVKFRLETGRTHQIRVHMASLGHPLLGDEVYGGLDKKVKTKIFGQCLHAKTIGFIHPTTNKYIEFNSELPEYFSKTLHFLKNMV